MHNFNVNMSYVSFYQYVGVTTYHKYCYKNLLQNKTGDFLYGSIENTVNKHLDFDLSKVYAFNSIMWIVPSSTRKNSKHIFRIVINEVVWILVILSITLLGIIFWLLSVLHFEKHEYSRLYMMATNVFRLFTCK